MKNIRKDREIEERCAMFIQKVERMVDAIEGRITTKVDEKQVREIVENMTIGGGGGLKRIPTKSHEAVLATVKGLSRYH